MPTTWDWALDVAVADSVVLSSSGRFRPVLVSARSRAAGRPRVRHHRPARPARRTGTARPGNRAGHLRLDPADPAVRHPGPGPPRGLPPPIAACRARPPRPRCVPPPAPVPRPARTRPNPPLIRGWAARVPEGRATVPFPEATGTSAGRTTQDGPGLGGTQRSGDPRRRSTRCLTGCRTPLAVPSAIMRRA
jgi:hypothetical protein